MQAMSYILDRPWVGSAVCMHNTAVQLYTYTSLRFAPTICIHKQSKTSPTMHAIIFTINAREGKQIELWSGKLDTEHLMKIAELRIF